MCRMPHGSRKRRIANGSGTQIQDVNRVLKQHLQMEKMMKKLSSPSGLMKMMRGMQGMMGGGGGMPPGMGGPGGGLPGPGGLKLPDGFKKK